MAAGSDPFSPVPDGVRVRVRLSPRSSSNRIAAIEVDGDGNGFIKAMVTTVPEAGKANAALIKMLSRQWKLPKSTIEVVQGATDRNKTIRVAGETDVLMQRMHQWLSAYQKEE